MKKETLINRIASKEKSIEKLTKKHDKIFRDMAAYEASGQDLRAFEYTWLARDLKSINRELTNEANLLTKYYIELAIQEEKEASRNVEAIMNFLEMWKEDTINWLLKERERYLEASREYHEKSDEFDRQYFEASKTDKELAKKIRKDATTYRNKFREDWLHVTQFNHGSSNWEDTMRSDIEDEKIRKYDDLVERVTKITGKIVDASGLRIDGRSNLNGIIVGENAKANVQTVEAGGYHIQRLHYRTLVNKV